MMGSRVFQPSKATGRFSRPFCKALSVAARRLNWMVGARHLRPAFCPLGRQLIKGTLGALRQILEFKAILFAHQARFAGVSNASPGEGAAAQLQFKVPRSLLELV